MRLTADDTPRRIAILSQTSTLAQQLLQPGDIETHHGFTVYYGYRRGHMAEFLEFGQSGFVSGDVSIREFYFVL